MYMKYFEYVMLNIWYVTYVSKFIIFIFQI